MKAQGILVAGMMVASVASGVELVKNGDFEAGGPGRAESWYLPPHFRLEESGGLNGNRGVAWTNDNPAMMGEWIDQRIAVKPGVAYKLSCWARCEDLQGMTKAGEKGCALLNLTVADKDGNYICEYRSSRISGTKPWTKLEGVTGKLAPNAAQIKVTPFVWHNSTGKAWFDEVSIEPIEAKPIGGLWSSAYRDTAWEGEVTFFAQLGIDETKTPLDSLTVGFAYSDGGFGTKRIRIKSFSQSEARVTVPVAKLPMGTMPVSVEIWQGRKLLAEESLPFTRTATAPNWKCRFDSANRLIVDGKPFFPLGVFDYGASDTSLANLKKAPFNCIMPYDMLSKPRWDAIQASGLKLIATMKDFVPHPHYISMKIESEGDADRALLCRFNQLKDHPALIAWYMNDEGSVAQIPRLERQYRLVRERDPDHPAYAVLCKMDSMRDYSGTCDILGTDPYPVNDHPLSLCSDFARETSRAFFGRPIWQVPQCFAWKWFRYRGGKGDPNDGKSRMPTKSEIRAMTWQHIVNGGNGIIYYCMGTMMREMKPEEFKAAWQEVCEVATEVADQFPVLLADPAPNAVSETKGVSSRAWQQGETTYLLVVNETAEEQSATLKLPRRFTSVKSRLDEAEAKFEGERLELKLLGLGATILELR